MALSLLYLFFVSGLNFKAVLLDRSPVPLVRMHSVIHTFIRTSEQELHIILHTSQPLLKAQH
ncbi:hypothetical protein O6H91_09G083400 [Diphasiastrum complanatum]|uniref:Uncharacterized protein n=1 Tax=Diphasiastrum complanatum TaxID=34168 RepID=A0ACC2CRG3_DIPCM|nr:hypothetical protein O6H91_09G083400 [Diphasiastrum complanatum]